MIISLAWSITGFSAYYLLSRNDLLPGRLRSGVSKRELSIIRVLIQRFWGVAFLGIFSAAIIRMVLDEPLSAYGFSFVFRKPPPWWSYPALVLILLSTYFHAPTSRNLAIYPQIRVREWTLKLLLINGISWLIYLVAYEFLFRGFLLFGSLSVLDPLPAVLLNCTLYALAHTYKGPLETIGAIPFGLLLCYLTLVTGNILSALVIHASMALFHDWMSVRAHPDMKVTGIRKIRKAESLEGQ
jgi:membrane protease YdiL (CAAX protease family)